MEGVDAAPPPQPIAIVCKARQQRRHHPSAPATLGLPSYKSLHSNDNVRASRTITVLIKQRSETDSKLLFINIYARNKPCTDS